MNDSTKEPGKKGLAGITADHRRAWEAGSLSYAAIGRELGIKKQSVAAYAKRNGWNCKPAPTEPSPPIAVRPAPSPPPQAADADMAERDRLNLIQISRILLAKVLEFMKGPVDLMGLQRAQTVLRGVREEWSVLGHFAPLVAAQEERLPVLTIRRMTDEEEAETRAQAEADYYESFGSNEPSNTGESATSSDGVMDTSAAPDRTRTSKPTHQCGEQAGNSDGGRDRSDGQAGNRQGQGPSTAPARYRLPRDLSLPEANEFRQWLEALGDRCGRVTLQNLATALGGLDESDTVPRSRVFLIGQILHHTGANPARLLPFMAGETA